MSTPRPVPLFAGVLYRTIVKPICFRFDPEDIHDAITSLGVFMGRFSLVRRALQWAFVYQNPRLKQIIAGIPFLNPVGLSAGFDKNVKLVSLLPSIGFGAAEFGSITLKPYGGNPKPRLVRLPKSKGIVVNYGLMNDGAEAIIPRFRADTNGMVVGVSIAKTNSTETATVEHGVEDYAQCLQLVKDAEVGDYYTLNVSCPNTFGGEPFTTKESLTMLLERVQKIGATKPIFVKLPINLSMDDLDSLLRVCVQFCVAGVIIGNLNKVRDPHVIHDPVAYQVKGGISGKPTEDLSNACISYTHKHYGDSLYIIGLGGIFSAEDAYAKIRAGASLVQLITGMIFEGPQLIGEINAGLVKLLERDGFASIAEAVGSDYQLP